MYLKLIFKFQVIEAITTISSSSLYNPKSSSIAICLLNALREFELTLSLHVSRQLLFHFKSVTVALQGVDVDIVNGFFMIKTVKETLENVHLITA